MKDVFAWLRELIELALFISGAVAIAWKWLDAWEKRKTAAIKEMLSRIEKNEARLTEVESCCQKHDEEMKGIKDNAKELLHLIIEQFKK